MKNLRDFTIFLHGPSGSGKGEIQRKLTEKYSQQGYEVQYLSSGDLYREALARPEIAVIYKRGGYFDTLEAVLPGLKAKYEGFIKQWFESNGKAILLLDGLIRRGEFHNKEGQFIPSQIDQIAEALGEVRQGFHQLPHLDIDELANEVTGSKHILVDINPKDAEFQMRLRASKELTSIRQQLEARIEAGYFPFESTALMYLLLNGISDVINAEITTEQELEVVSSEVQRVRQEIASSIGIEGNGSFGNFFQKLGISTQLRDDDISPLARRKRIENYVTTSERSEGTSYTPGFAAQALIEGLGYQFSPDGSFISTRENCVVIRNGRSKGIELQAFQGECEYVGTHLLQETDEARAEMFVDPEGKRKSKEG